MNMWDAELSTDHLYPEAPELCFQALADALNTVVSAHDLRFDLAPMAGTHFAILSHPAVHLTLAVNAAPLPGDALDTALEAPLLRSRADEFQALVKAHRHTIRITLGDGPGFGSDTRQRPMAMADKLRLLHRATCCLTELTEPVLVHWRQSDMLISAADVTRTRDAAFPAPLMLRLEEIPSATGGRTGYRAQGAELILGEPLSISQGALPLSAAQAISELLVTQAAAGGDWKAICPFPLTEETEIALCTKSCGGSGFVLSERPVAPDPEDLPAGEELLDVTFWKAAPTRADMVRTFVLCAGMVLMIPAAGAAMLLWNLLRGPNVIITATTFVMALLVFTSISLHTLVSSETLALEDTATVTEVF